MKKLIYLCFTVVIFSCQDQTKITSKNVDISCGQCQFDIEGDGCSLAVRFPDLDNKAYFIEGFKIDDFGDAHDEHKGFCNVIRKGDIVGTIKEGKFVASSLTMID